MNLIHACDLLKFNNNIQSSTLISLALFYHFLHKQKQLNKEFQHICVIIKRLFIRLRSLCTHVILWSLFDSLKQKTKPVPEIL